MAAFLGSKLTGLVRQVLIARAFGTGPELDAYYAAFTVPDLLFTLISGGALGSALLPVLAGYFARHDPDEGWTLASTVLNLVFLAAAALAAVIALAAPILARTIVAPGFTPEMQALTAQLMRLILLSTVTFAVSGVLTGILHTHQHFLLPALAPMLYDTGIIAGAVFLAAPLGVFGLAVGVVGGALLHLGIQIPGLIRLGVRWRPTIYLDHPGLGRVLVLMGPRILDMGVFQLNLLLTTNLASRLAAGSVSALNFGWMLLQVPETIIGSAIATAAFPALTALASRGDSHGFRVTLSGITRAILVLAIPATLGLILLGRPAVELLFQRGAFGAESTEMVIFALRFYALGLIGHSVLEIATRSFFARQDTVTPLIVAVGGFLAYWLLALWWRGWLAHGGLALANSTAITLEVLVLFWIARRRGVGPDVASVLRCASRTALATAVMGLALLGFLMFQRGAGSWVLALGGGGLACAVFVAAAVALNVEEVRALPRWVLSPRSLQEAQPGSLPGSEG
jgi:putative peptidoglycan lipid II flippase